MSSDRSYPGCCPSTSSQLTQGAPSSIGHFSPAHLYLPRDEANCHSPRALLFVFHSIFFFFFNHTPQRISSHTCRKILAVQTGTGLPQHCHQLRGVHTTSQPTRSLAPVPCPVLTPLVGLHKHHLPKLALYSPINLFFPLF